MTQKNTSSKRAGKQQYSASTIVVALLIVLAYWWLTGSLPGSEEPQNTAVVANVPAIATARVAATVDATPPPEVTADRGAQVSTETPTSEPTAATTDAGVVAVAAVEESMAATATETALPTAIPPTATPTAMATPLPTPTATTPPKPTALPTNPPRAGPRGMAVITLDELPPEALETIDLIMADGPFPFDRDGITFQNREGLLPNQARGYYSEYTVITPGVRTRGARRIIAGADGELYYTDNHYASFHWIALP
jgi:ribonuclease T1